MISDIAKRLWPFAAMLVMVLAAIAFRPLLPIDETRYMTVAWEMFLRRGWLEPLTVNFAPYHHKPPLLFWLINLSWSVFGVSRWAGLVPVALSSLACVYLTGAMGKMLFGKDAEEQRVRLVMAGSFPFIIYGTLVMFDFLLCAFVLLSLICLLRFSRGRRLRYMAAMGVCLGLGVLAKGPVAYLYVLPAALLAPFWAAGFSRPAQWYGGILTAVFFSALPVSFWLVPVLRASDSEFAFWLVWNQTAGRVTGSFSASHVRPVWFYLPLVPVLFMPWLFFPSFWSGLSDVKAKIKAHEGLRFLLFWTVPVLAAFSFISGKQPHYLVPLLPGAVLFAAYCLRDLNIRTMAAAFAVLLAILTGGQAAASQTEFRRYTLENIAAIIRDQPGRDLAFVRNYHGEIGFLARRERPVDDLQMDEVGPWFEEHPHGWAIIRFKDGQSEIEKYKKIVSYTYRGKNIGVFEK